MSKREKTLFLGNGFSRAICKSMKPWGGLLESEESHIKNYTVLYEVGCLKRIKDGNDELDVKKQLMDNIRCSIEFKEEYNNDIDLFGKNLERLNITNIITTNYDGIIEDILERCKYKQEKNEISYPEEEIYSVRRKKQYYCCISNHKITLWKIHGDGIGAHADLCKTLTLGLDHYCGYIARLSDYIKGKYESHNGKPTCDIEIEKKWLNNSSGVKLWDDLSWVELFFKTDLYISGFGMDYSEIDIWWLINRRARIIKKHIRNGDFHLNNICYLYSSCYDYKKTDIIEALEAFYVRCHGISTCANYINNLFKAIDKIDGFVL